MLPPRPAFPSINRAHPANRELYFSLVAGGGVSAFDQQGRQFGAVTNTLTSTATNIIGNTLGFGDSPYVTFSGKPAIIESTATFGCIILFSALTHNAHILCTSSVATLNSGLRFTIQLPTFQVIDNAVAYLSGISVTTGIPYLLLATINRSTSTAYFLVKDLSLGTVSVATATAAPTPVAGNGSYIVGSRDGGAAALNGALGAMLFSRAYLGPAGLMSWAQDPWGPWRDTMNDTAAISALKQGAPSTSKYLVKPIFTLPGGLIVPVGVGAYAARAMRRNAAMTRRRAMNFLGWNSEKE